ncbi:AraC family transcriptional regulator [Galbibacter sp. EGI 63066]|uniref:helix-turn-helix domain-containing protein n=1 Tax=Galbibacter sp. EGI 63066 TaxID=2993559 RepID=UPI00224875DC|nr:AraC family transcriptional regulator [Galbibacter sp. EGI 63066]MCX2680658.1 AraC family transcriptional regulator [Galbibacter sp. EGI 63066]
MIISAVASRDTALISAAHVTKGMVFLNDRKYRQALDHLLLAEKLANTTTGQPYLIHKIQYNLAQIYYQLEQYPDAVKLFNLSLHYFRDKQAKAYMKSLHALARCHTQMKNYGMSNKLNRRGVKEGKQLGDTAMVPYFMQSAGINKYGEQNFKLAIAKLDSALPAVKTKKDFANVAITHFYLGKSHKALNREAEGISHFKRVDSIFEKTGYIKPELKENYRLLMNYYQHQDSTDMYLYYIEQLLKVDSVLQERYKYLSGKMYREYNSAKLIREKQRVTDLLEKKKRKEVLLTGGASLLAILLFFGAFRFYNIKKKYRERFKALMYHGSLPTKVEEAEVGTLDIPKETVDTILKQLDKFEKGLKFKNEDINLERLAVYTDTNTKYVSQVISHFRGQKFPDYLNELRLNYIIELLKTDAMARKYSIKALAKEAGYTTTARFTNAFKAKYGIPPSFYLKELDKLK